MNLLLLKKRSIFVISGVVALLLALASCVENSSQVANADATVKIGLNCLTVKTWTGGTSKLQVMSLMKISIIQFGLKMAL